MAEAGVRVALLARAGNARDQLRRALAELGAELVAEGDPAELDPGQVIGQSPNLVVVSLEPATEAALDRFDELLSMAGVEVMFDDAEVTRQLDGWDLNRWARHLAAKLLGRDVLPPAPGNADLVPNADLSPVPGAPPTPAQLMADARFEEYAQDAPELAEWVPTEPSLTKTDDGDADAAEPAPEAGGEAGEIAFDLDLGDVEAALQQIDAGTGVASPAAAATTEPEPAADELALDNDFPLEVDLSHLDQGTAEASPEPEPMDMDADMTTLADFEVAEQPVKFSNFDHDETVEEIGDLDADVAALAAQLEAFEKNDTRAAPRDPDFAFAAPEGDEGAEPAPSPTASAPTPTPAAAPAPAAKTGGSLDFSNLSLAGDDDHVSPPAAPAAPASDSSLLSALSLEPMDDAPAAAPTPAAMASAPAVSFGSSLSLEAIDGEPAAPAPSARAPAAGAVLILAGMGGPDPVRQILSSLPTDLPVPVLLYQHLEVGKHDRLAEQLGKISRLPVRLASEGQTAAIATVNLLPTGISASFEQGALRFAPGTLAQLLAALPAADSVVVALSGADADLVPAMLALQQAGGLALAQDVENCFDPAAVQVLIQQGAASYPALGIAQQIGRRWA